MVLKCECCRKELKDPMPGQKFCSSCAVYTNSIRIKISRYKSEIRKLKTIIYGQPNGAQKVNYGKKKG